MPWLVGYPREKIDWHPRIDYEKCTTCANLCPEWAISFPKITEVRRLYEENDIWGKISRAMKEEGQI